MSFINQTCHAVKKLPLFFKSIMFIWSALPVIFIIPKLKHYTLLDSAYAIAFILIWVFGTLAITLTHVFFRQYKLSIHEYAKKNSVPKIGSQSIAAAMQSKVAYQNLLTRLPPNLANDVGLFVGAKCGRISKTFMIVLTIVYFGESIIKAKLFP